MNKNIEQFLLKNCTFHETSSREEWLKARANTIGGSDIGILLYNAYNKTSQDLYKTKISNSFKDDGATSVMNLGSFLEQKILDLYEEQTGARVYRKIPTLKSKKYDFLHANIDGITDDNEPIIVEAKYVTRGFSTNEWYTPAKEAQLMHYLGVTGSREAHIIAMNPYGEVKIKCVQRDITKILKGRRKAKWFYDNHLVPKIIPPAELKSDTDHLHSAVAIACTAKTRKNLIKLYEIDCELKTLNAEKNTLKDFIAVEMEEKEEILNEKNRAIVQYKHNGSRRSMRFNFKNL